MACSETTADDIFSRERAARDAALRRINDAVSPDLAADLAGEAFFEFRRGLLQTPGMTSAVVFNNNPCSFRAAEWTELKKLLAESGYVIDREGQSPADGQEQAGYTLVLIVRPAAGGAVDPAVVSSLMETALVNIGHGGQRFHGVHIDG